MVTVIPSELLPLFAGVEVLQFSTVLKDCLLIQVPESCVHLISQRQCLIANTLKHSCYKEIHIYSPSAEGEPVLRLSLPLEILRQTDECLIESFNERRAMGG